MAIAADRESIPSGGAVLRVEGLRVDIVADGVDIVAEVSFSLAPGRIVGIVGESGSGKTTVAMALLGVSRGGARVTAGSARLDQLELFGGPEKAGRRERARRIAYVPQNPATSLSPGMRIGRQLAEVVEADRGAVDTRVRAALRLAQLPDDDAFLRRYPFQLSGGQQQRVLIAMAVISRPDVIVMDEPTTGLDVTTEARLLQEVRDLAGNLGTGIVYISHNLGVVRNIAHDVLVMYGGRVVEAAPVDELFRSPRHPYTRRLLEAIPRLDGPATLPRGIPGSAVGPWDRPPGCPFAPRCDHRVPACDVMPPVEVEGGREVRCWRWRETPAAPAPHLAPAASPPRADEPSDALLRVDGLVAWYGKAARARLRGARGPQTVVHAVSFSATGGGCLGIVGESGSGKTTALRCIAGLHPSQEGTIELAGDVLRPRARDRSHEVRRRIQLVPQNPDSSLNPRLRVGEIVGRPLKQFYGLRGGERDRRVGELLEQVRLRASTAARFPRELSGGEKQRVAIARALAAKPDVLLCDEITSALDVAVQAGILTLLDDLRRTLGTTLVFVSHDLGVIRAISDRVVVMCEGVIRDDAETAVIFSRPVDEYTRDLLAAVPRLRADDYPGVRG